MKGDVVSHAVDAVTIPLQVCHCQALRSHFTSFGSEEYGNEAACTFLS